MVLVYVNLINPPKDKHPPLFMCEKCWDKSEKRSMLIKHEVSCRGPRRGTLPPEMVGGRKGGNDGEEGARWWKVSIENFDCFDEWLEWIDSIRMSKKTKIMMDAVFYTSWWMIWWFRNSKIFKEKAPKKACFLMSYKVNLLCGVVLGETNCLDGMIG
uniref:RNA-directed DNA polymerase, eukaryota, reverse transcriptase zinc-binding domain protein n=1 Tax=Tanacetum cinerariifolium TaxID=118510 RepID=A0A699IKE7_TANCI|nr:RNA-directed DNA polymerase, eukaryota, reverse transcriptase zinc-binding domain protein [Tanacetum cinerariifolium]